MELRARDAVVFDELQKRFAHPLNSDIKVEFGEINIGQSYVSFVTELLWSYGEGLESCAECAICI